MNTTPFARGDVLRSPGDRIVEVVERVTQGGQCVGYDVLGLGAGEGHGLRHFLAERLATSYRRVSVDGTWRELSYGLLQERFVRHGRDVVREVRRIESSS